MSDGTRHQALSRRRIMAYLVGLGIAAVLVSAPLANSSAASKTGPSAIPVPVARHLSAMMLRVAKLSGDPRPAWIKAVATTRSNGLRVATPGDTVPGSDHQSVYLVVMKGNFVLNDVPIPPGAHAPTGHYLAITLNPASFQAMDLGIRNLAPPVSLQSLGPVSNLMHQP